MKTIEFIYKRDGRKVEFDSQLINNAIKKAFIALGYSVTDIAFKLILSQRKSYVI